MKAGQDMQYVLVAFQNLDNVRQYAFNGTTEDGRKREFVVDVDLGLALRYRVPMQEIPLLCRRLLEEKPVVEQKQRVTLTAERMEIFAEHAAESKVRADQRKNWSFKPRPS